MKKLTVIIPFLNEGAEVENTVQSIRKTAGLNVEILLINDASYDNYDYSKVSNIYDTKYIENPIRIGVAGSRDIGVDNIQTDYFLMVDGHMRFYDNNWWEIILKNLEQNNRAIYCTSCRALDTNVCLIKDKPNFGAYIDILGDKGANFILSPMWLRKDWNQASTTMQIPCVLGATYASSKEYWKYIKGLSGLRTYGSDEAYISIKAWLEGGGCYLIKNVEIGHIFRNEFPYSIDYVSILYNKLLIIETLFPEVLKNEIYNVLRSAEGIFLRDAMGMILDNKDLINSLKNYYSEISTKDFNSFIYFNKEVQNMIT